MKLSFTNAMLWLPSVLMVGASPRAGLSFGSLWEMLVIKPIYLADWVRGLPVWDTSESARVSYAADGRPQSMQQLGWTIEYRDWHPAIEGRPALPRRIEARNGEAQVKLLVDRWDFTAP